MFKTQRIILADPGAFSHSPFVLAQFGVGERKDNAETQSTLRSAEQKRQHLKLAPCVDTVAAVLNTLLR